MEIATSITTWHWVTLGVVILILEALSATGFLLGIAAAAFLLAGAVALGWIVPWQHQLLWFSLLAVLLTLLYWRLFRRFNTRTDEPLLNDRAAQLIGRKLVLDEPLPAGQGRIRVGDTLWKAVADQELEAGTRIEVVGSEGMTLRVKAVAD